MAILGSLRIRTVATLGNVLLAAAAVGCAVMALNAAQTLGDSLAYAVNNTATGLSELDAARGGIGNTRLYLAKSMLARDAEAQRGVGEKLDEAMAKATDALDACRALIADRTEQGQYERLMTLWNDYKVRAKLVRSIPFAQAERARSAYETQITSREIPLSDAFDAEVAYKVALNKTTVATAQALAERYSEIAELLIAAVLVIAMAVILLLRHRLSVPLQRLTGAMEDMARGDLDRTTPGDALTDEIGEIGRALSAIKVSIAARTDALADQQMAVQRQVVGALGEALSALKNGRLTATIHQTFPGDYEILRTDFNEALTSLADLMHQVTSSAMSVRNGASEISAAASDLANRTEKQAASLEESSAAVRELNQSASSTAKTADDATRLAREAQASASESGDGMNRTVEAMNQIAGSSRQMEEIVSLIEGIAFQTNLLALNAGVEAARAGEAGRGFAVVATEVRALAQRSTDAAKDIGAIIKSSGRDVSQGVTLINQTQATLTQIVVSTQELSEMITHIAAASREQSVAITQIDAVVSDMDRSTQQNAALVEQSSAAAHSLSVAAATMTTLVEQFDLGRNSGAAGLRRAA